MAEIESGLDGLEARYASKLFEYQDRAIRRLAEMAVDGTLRPEMLIGPDAIKVFRDYRTLHAELMNILTHAQNFGVGQIREELRRQGVKAAR